VDGTINPESTSRLTRQVIVNQELDSMIVRWLES